MAICAQCGTDNPDVAKFCMACASPRSPRTRRRPSLHGGTRSAGRSRPSSSTSSARRAVPSSSTPRTCSRCSRPTTSGSRHVLEQHGGSVEKFIGDAVVALFGAPVAHEDDPERAVRAGLAIIGAIDALNEEDPSRELRVRVGVTTGEAIVALEARIGEGQGMAWGDVLNTAARLQSAAPVNGVLVDERDVPRLPGAIEFEDAEPITAKGKAEPVPVWVAVGVHASPIRRGAETSFVGRAAELERLMTAWNRVIATDTPGFAIVVGEPGLGKSRLLHEISARAEGADVRVGNCLPYGEGITYFPVVQIMRDAAGVLFGDPIDVVSAKLDVFLDRLPLDDLDQLQDNRLDTFEPPRRAHHAARLLRDHGHLAGRAALGHPSHLRAPRVATAAADRARGPALGGADVDRARRVARRPRRPGARARLGAPEVGDTQPKLLVERDRRTVVALDVLSADDSATLVSELVAQLEERGLPRSAGRTARRKGERQPALPRGDRPHARGRRDTRRRSARGAARAGEPAGAGVGPPRRSPGNERRLAQHASVAGMTFWSGAAALLDDRTEPPERPARVARRRGPCCTSTAPRPSPASANGSSSMC